MGFVYIIIAICIGILLILLILDLINNKKINNSTTNENSEKIANTDEGDIVEDFFFIKKINKYDDSFNNFNNFANRESVDEHVHDPQMKNELEEIEQEFRQNEFFEIAEQVNADIDSVHEDQQVNAIFDDLGIAFMPEDEEGEKNNSVISNDGVASGEDKKDYLDEEKLKDLIRKNKGLFDP